LATGCDGLGSTGSLSHFIYMFIHLYVWFLCEKINYYTLLEASPQCSSTSAAALLRPRRFVDSFLHHSPNAVINRIELRTVGGPQVRSNEFMNLTTNQL